MAEYLDYTGLSHFKDKLDDTYAQYFDDLKPLATGTYTDLYANPNNFAGGTFYFAKVIPDDYYKPWKVVYKVHAYVPNQANYNGYYIVTACGCQSALSNYLAHNSFYSTSYRPIYTHIIYRAKLAGATTYGHLLGERIYSATNGNSTSYKRTLEIELLSQENCTVTLFDNAILYANAEGTGSTNYDTYSELNGYDHGFKMTGDANTNYYDRTLLDEVRLTAGTNGIKQYSLIMQKPDGTWESFTAEGGTVTTKTKNTNGFIFPSKIYRYSYSNNIDNGSLTTKDYVYDVTSFDLQYSTNCGTTLVANKSIYLVGTIGSDGLFYLADTWWTQTIPTTEDGKIYIYLGEAYSTYQCILVSDNTAYWYKDGAFREYAYVSSDYVKDSDLSTVATSGSYNDLTDKPTIPSAYTLPTASSTTLGGIKVGTNLSISNGVLSATDTKAWADITGKPNFATVATSGSYNDLSNKPTIPTVPTNVSAFTNDSGYITGVSWSEVTSKPTFATVATSGSYNDLTNKPTIPTVPTNISSFTNDSGYITSAHEINNPRNIEYIVGTQTAATGAWKGVTQDTELYDGKRILYYLPYAGSGNASLELTYPNGTTSGAKNCYYMGTTRLTTHYGAGNVIPLTYVSAKGWMCDPNYDANTYDRILLSNTRVTAGTNGIFPYSLIMQRPDDTWEALTTTGGTGTTKTKNTHGFVLGKIWCFNANATITSGNLTTATNYLYDCMPLSLQYITNCGTTLIARKPVYLVGTIGTDGLFYLSDTWWTQTLPTTEDGKIYIYLGDAYSTSQIYFVEHNFVYWYKDGAFRQYSYVSENAINDLIDAKIAAITDGDGVSY